MIIIIIGVYAMFLYCSSILQTLIHKILGNSCYMLWWQITNHEIWGHINYSCDGELPRTLHGAGGICIKPLKSLCFLRAEMIRGIRHLFLINPLSSHTTFKATYNKKHSLKIIVATKFTLRRRRDCCMRESRLVLRIEVKSKRPGNLGIMSFVTSTSL